MEKNKKWSENNNSFILTTGINDKLPADIYGISVLFGGNVAFTKINLVTDSLYVLPRSTTGVIMEELNRFWGSREIFSSFGLLHKRGILLYGPPGTGKSSIINLVAKEAIAMDACCFIVRNPNNASKGLTTYREAHPDRPAIVFLEDVDDICLDDEEGLLNLLDGSSQINNVVYIATTNNLSDLPQRIQNRPSRFDKKIEIGYPDVESRYKYLCLIAKVEDSNEYQEWADKTDGLSFAHLKELFIGVKILGGQLDEVIERLKEMAESGEVDDLETDDDNDDDD